MVRLPSAGAIFSILTITQALSLAGVAVEINVMAWMYLIPAWMILSMIAHIVAFVGYDAAYSWYAEDTTNNATGGTLMTTIGNEVYMMVAKETAMMMNFVFAHKAWMMGQFMMMDEETQEKWMEKKGRARSTTTMTTRTTWSSALPLF